MNIIKITAILATALATSTTYAQTSNGPFYGGLEFGASQIEDNSGALASSMRSSLGGTASASQDTSLSSYRFFGGYKLNENVNFELGYAQSGDLRSTFSGKSGGNIAYTGSANLKYSGFDYSVALRPSTSTGYNNAFLKLGVTNYKVDVSATATAGISTASQSRSESGSGLLFGAGYDLNVANSFDIRFAVNRLTNVAGSSNNNVTSYSIGLLKSF